MSEIPFHLFYVMLHDICQVARLSFLKKTEREFFQMLDNLQS